MMEAQDVLDVLALLDEERVTAVLDGGWGIDALLGAQHRDHDDLDLVVLLSELDTVLDTLGSVGFAIETDERPTRIALADRAGRAIDLHLTRVDGDGDFWQAAARPDGTDARYRASQLTSGWVGGHQVRCISADLQVAHHTGYPPRPRDVHDLGLLQRQYGIGLPEGYR